MSDPTHLHVRPSEDGGWEVLLPFAGRESHHLTMDAALRHAEGLILEDLQSLSTLLVHRFNGVIETRIYQPMEYIVDPATDPVFRASMELR
jgi:hypothetical protein